MSDSIATADPMMQFNVRKGLQSTVAHAPMLTREARLRLRWLEWHRAHGGNASLTCRHFGLSRATFYRWQARYDPRHMVTLQSRTHQPRHRRTPTWTATQRQAVLEIRRRYPRWGKDKLVVVLRRDGLDLSVSMVGRILTELHQLRLLHEPRSTISARKRRSRRPYAIRKPRDYVVSAPGDLAQIDTLDVRPLPGYIHKHFSLIDCVSRYALVALRGRATARTAQESLALMLQRSPFPVRALQIDGGSEFMAEFEEFCQAQGIRLFVLPPRSPKLNGQVERSQRTHTEEFYECTDAGPAVAELARELANWEVVYNTIRPHQSLGYLTPMEFLQTTHPELFDQEVSA